MRFRYLPLVGLLFVTACASNEGVLVCHVSGGETVKIPMTAKGPEHANNKDIRVEAAAGYVENDKLLKYGFVFTVLTKVPPKKVKVEDVSEREAEVLMEDDSPKLDEHGVWRGTSPPKAADDKSLGWLYHLDTSFRVYRFTIVTGDERTLVMYQASIIPSFIKVGMRAAMDMK